MFPHLLKNAPFAPCQACPMSESEGYLFIRLSSPMAASTMVDAAKGRGSRYTVGGDSWEHRAASPRQWATVLSREIVEEAGRTALQWKGHTPCWSLSLLSPPALGSGSVSGAAGTLPMPCARLPVGRLLSSVISPRWNRLTGLWFREGHSPRGSESSAESFGTSWIQQKVDSQNKLPKYFLQSVT